MNPALELSVADLFCGCGGMSLGFSAADCHIALGVDHDAVAASSYLHNFSRIQPDDPPDVRAGLEGDVGEIDFGSLLARSPDILIGGPPCQGFSRVGRAKLRALGAEAPGQDERNDLYLKFLDAAEYWKPKAVVMENVPGMLSIGGKNIALLAASDLADRGFRVGYARLNAVWYGVPQFRERFIMIGIRDDLNQAASMPAATHRAKLSSGSAKPMAFEDWTPTFAFNKFEELPVELNGASANATSAEEALGDLPATVEHLKKGAPAGARNLTERMKYGSAARSEFAKLMRTWPGLPASKDVADHFSRRTPRDYETFARMREDDKYPDAHRIAVGRFEESLSDMENSGRHFPEGSSEYDELRRQFVPPYPLDQFLDKWRKLSRKSPSWTVPAHLSKDSYSHIHYDSAQARMVTIREAARLQSFPDSFEFKGNMGDRFRQIGNAVPPLLAKAIAEEVVKVISGGDAGE